ncbi:MAG: GAF domain-containing protein [Gammaproteobacteria bacterium]|nr:GAF domain-containing protein [Gammaproteobacteria bacterium]
MTANLETIDFGHDAAAKARGYRELQDALRALLAGERDAIANLANTAALLYGNLPQLNWAGFYLLTRNDNAAINDNAAKEELVLGPFQGKPACVRIALGRGVCGTTAARRVTTVVPNVHEFPGHIACDSASNSEIVVPMIVNEGPHKGSLLGVLDLDSPVLARFDAIDREGLERVVEVLISSTSWP